MKKLTNYIIFGILTSILNIVLFTVLIKLNIEYQISNLITLIIVKIVSYICNKKFVFKSKYNSTKELVKEFFTFILFRSFTLIIDFFGLILLVELFNMDKTVGKIIVTIIVIIINYIGSEKIIFKQK